MNTFNLKPLLAALLLAGSCAAQAAHFEVVDYLGFGGYSGTADGVSFSADALDLSAAGDVTFFGANDLSSASTTHGYAADGFYIASSQNFSMSLSQYATTAAAFSGSNLLALNGIGLKLVSDGEANGADVFISFSGLASVVNSHPADSGLHNIDMSVTRGSDTLGSYLWDASSVGTADQVVSFGFAAKVGDEVLLSGNMLSQLSNTGGAFDASSSGQLAGAFTVTAVPEPGTYAMLLAGLGLMGLAAKRRKN